MIYIIIIIIYNSGICFPNVATTTGIAVIPPFGANTFLAPKISFTDDTLGNYLKFIPLL